MTTTPQPTRLQSNAAKHASQQNTATNGSPKKSTPLPPKRVLPSRARRGGPGVGSCETDVMILDTLRRRRMSQSLLLSVRCTHIQQSKMSPLSPQPPTSCSLPTRPSSPPLPTRPLSRPKSTHTRMVATSTSQKSRGRIASSSSYRPLSSPS